MLALTRYVGERIVLEWTDGRTATVELVAVRSSRQAKIGIDAPRDVKIRREELERTENPKGVKP